MYAVASACGSSRAYACLYVIRSLFSLPTFLAAKKRAPAKRCSFSSFLVFPHCPCFCPCFSLEPLVFLTFFQHIPSLLASRRLLRAILQFFFPFLFFFSLFFSLFLFSYALDELNVALLSFYPAKTTLAGSVDILGHVGLFVFFGVFLCLLSISL